MRERVFRGKDEFGAWFIGYYVAKHDPLFAGRTHHYILDQADEDNYGCLIPTISWHRVISETVGQYTGLTDKNGKMIFEGDIIKHHQTLWGEDVSDIGLVLWCERTCKFYRTSKRDTVGSLEIWEETAERYEVIGNIYDNPELMKGENSDER